MLSRIITFYHPHGHPKVGAISNLPTAEEETEAHRGDVTFPHKDTWQKVSAQELDLNGLVFRLPKADHPGETEAAPGRPWLLAAGATPSQPIGDGDAVF